MPDLIGFRGGAPIIARAGKLPVFYIAKRRKSRGHYSMRFVHIAAAARLT